MNTIKNTSILTLLFFSLFSYSQNSYEFYTRIGASNFNEVNYSEYDIVGNSFDYAFSYNIGGLYVKSFSDETYKVKTGIVYSSIATKMGVKKEFQIDGFNTSTSVLKYEALIIPMEFSYAFETWMLINVGVDNKFIVKQPKFIDGNKYALSFNGGVDFKIYNNYLVGINYNHDITPMWKQKGLDISYYSNQFSVKIAYLLR